MITHPPRVRRGGALTALALALAAVLGVGQTDPTTSEWVPPPRKRLITFDEPGFPLVDAPGGVLTVVPGAEPHVSAEAFIGALDPATAHTNIVVWRHGATFPAEAWPAFVAFLEAGGSFLHLGAAPFTRPVTGSTGARVTGPRTLAMLKALALNQCYRVDASRAIVTYGLIVPRQRRRPRGAPRRGVVWSNTNDTEPFDESAPDPEVPTIFDRIPPERFTLGDAYVDILEPRLTNARDFDDEDGSAGPRDAIIRPLARLGRTDGDRFPFATAAVAIDRVRGRFAGGRWTFRLLSTAADAEVRRLVAAASHEPLEVRLDPTFGNFRPGERPSVHLRIHRPRGRLARTLALGLRITGPDEKPGPYRRFEIDVARHANVEIPLDRAAGPGLYRMTLKTVGAGDVTTGFWVHDRSLFEGGNTLSFDTYTMRRDGKPEPVIGTTVMSSTVHRKFLFEPNAADWDDTFAELGSIGVNLVRTGVWTGYRKISLDANHVDEAFLRALEAYYLSARKHGIPVVFTFFAFVPPAFGAENPYFDPRAIEGQQALIGAIASRFRQAKEIVWDLINEPSFSNPKKLWLCRPTGDRHERRAFRAWLAKRYGGGKRAWEDVVRARWRLAPGEAIGLPMEGDFQERNLFELHRPYRARDWLLFAQDAFARWSRQMIRAIRDAGSSAPVTVGQDEGGLNDRPHPQTHAAALDFTSIHSWWYNDALLWDALMSKAPEKPLLVSETGIMQRELRSGEAVRDPASFARLLSRKIGYAFAGRAFGLVQWCYDVNPYMVLDNEVAIGLRRADGSYKPEHGVLRAFAAFLRRNGRRFERPREPDIVLVLPHEDLVSPRGLQVAGTKRAIHALCEVLGRSVRVVLADRLTADVGKPAAVILPACRGIRDETWLGLKARVASGATLVCSGWFEQDDAGHAAHRLGTPGEPLRRRELAEAEVYGDGEWRPALRFGADVTQSVYAADLPSRPHRIRFGRGSIVHHPIPIEWAEPSPAQAAWYAEHLPPPAVAPVHASRGVRIHWLRFERANLAVMINVSSEDRVVEVHEKRDHFTIPAGVARMFLFDRDGTLVDRSHPEATSGGGTERSGHR